MRTINQGVESNGQLSRYYYEDIQGMFDIKRTALGNRIRAATIKPHVDENSKERYLDPEQLEEFRLVHDFMDKGGIAAHYRGKYTEQQNPADAQGDAIGIDKYGGEILPISEWDAIRRNALDAIAMNCRLQTYAQFEIFLNSNQTLTDKEIVELIGFKPPRTGYLYDCYRFHRYSNIHVLHNGVLVKQSTWKLEKVNIERQNFLRQEKRRQSKLAAAAAAEEEERAIAVYGGLKNAIATS